LYQLTFLAEAEKIDTNSAYVNIPISNSPKKKGGLVLKKINKEVIPNVFR